MEIFFWLEIIAIAGLAVGLVVSRGERRKKVLQIMTMVLSVYGGVQYLLIGAIGSLLLSIRYLFNGAFGHQAEHLSIVWVLVAAGVFIAGIIGMRGGFLARRWPQRGALRLYGAAGYFTVAAVAFAVSFSQEQIGFEAIWIWAVCCFPAVLLALAGVTAHAADRIVVSAASYMSEAS